VLEIPPDEPPANWPDADRQWLQELVDERGPLEVPTTGVDDDRVWDS
jgi:hypothetical protein